MENKKITIIGLGLIGGSLAKAFNERLGIKNITAVDRNKQSVNQALQEGVISMGFSDLNDRIWDSDAIIICTPVKQAFDCIDIIAGRAKPGCIVTDVCSTKAEIAQYVDKLSTPLLFIGGHPMAGTEKAGYASGFSHLFENAYYILCPCRSTSSTALSFMSELVAGIGAIPIVMDAVKHDRITGCISHIPHIIASALVNMVKQMDTPDAMMQLLAAGGFKDITRIASANPLMWENIVISNKDEIVDILDTYITIIDEVREYIRSQDRENIYDFFDSAKKYRDLFSSSKKGLISPVHEIVIDVVDKPGMIGEIATILGSYGINIKNINVSNSREFEQGCLRITLPDSESINSSYDLLKLKGYKVYK